MNAKLTTHQRLVNTFAKQPLFLSKIVLKQLGSAFPATGRIIPRR